MRMGDDAGIGLLDAGDGRRLDRFGGRVVDRPAPAADGRRLRPARWREADLRFEPGDGWSGRVAHDPWAVTIDGLTLELRASPSGGVGLFTEQLANLAWLEARVAERGAGVTILNLFAHTGLLTLAAARAGAAVAHVDASRPAVAWARRNAELSGLADRPIRWLVDDAASFVVREARRGRRYDGLVLDPPSFGRAGARRWRLLDDLPGLLEACASALAPDGFALLTAHTAGVDERFLAHAAAQALGRRTLDVAPLVLDAESGARLELGWAVRIEAGPAR
jgi:23S rRNA (cytosine1962-C5)-methyltransferase